MPKFKVQIFKTEIIEIEASSEFAVEEKISRERPEFNGYTLESIEEMKSPLTIAAEEFASAYGDENTRDWITAKQAYFAGASIERTQPTKSDLPKRGVHKWETYMFNLLEAMGGTAKKIDMLRAVISVNHDNSTCKDVRRLAVTGVNNGLGKNLESGKISKPDGRSNMDTVYTLISKN